MTENTYSDILGSLEGLSECGDDAWTAMCPAHDDNRESLSVRIVDNKLYLKCFKGCSNENVVESLGYQMKDLFPNRGQFGQKAREKVDVEARFFYRNEKGEAVLRVTRVRTQSGRKSFWQHYRLNQSQKWSKKKPEGFIDIPYGLRMLADTTSPVIVPEGEKKCEALWKMGYCATCNAGGANSWRSEFGRWFSGRDLIVMPDNDEPGLAHAASVAASGIIHGAKSIRVVRLPVEPKGDVLDFIESGGTKKELAECILDSPVWLRSPASQSGQ